MKSIQLGTMIIPLDNIDYVNEGDGTAYNKPYLLLKSGRRINLEWDDISKLDKAMGSEDEK